MSSAWEKQENNLFCIMHVMLVSIGLLWLDGADGELFENEYVWRIRAGNSIQFE